jgi:hypothetical protein
MMKIWQKEVTNLLLNNKGKSNLMSLLIKTFKRFFANEVNKVYGCDIRRHKSRSEPPHLFAINIEENGIMEEGDLLHMESFSVEGNFMAQFYLEKQISGLNKKENLKENLIPKNFLNQNNHDNKLSILEEVYKPEFQDKYFLEQYSFNKYIILDYHLFYLTLCVMNIAYFT